MSGECEKCSEHALECICRIMDKEELIHKLNDLYVQTEGEMISHMRQCNCERCQKEADKMQKELYELGVRFTTPKPTSEKRKGK